jgi:tetraacyldisaccharide 4'-kinase
MYEWLQRVWYGGARSGLVLLPLSLLYAAVVSARRKLYDWGALSVHDVGVPVIVVGNLTTGGTGKTPFTLWLAQQLASRGHRPGIVLRGYGGSRSEPRLVSRDATASSVGDEALILARRSSAPVAVGADRVGAARLLAAQGVGVIVSDDGLQHRRLDRSLEIVVIDGVRGLGNGHLLPAGPLREPRSRLASIDMIVINGEGAAPVHPPSIPVYPMRLEPGAVRSLATGEERSLETFRGQRVHAVAAIGNPQRFFTTLRACGLDPVGHVWPDHHALEPADVAFGDALPVLMTEKDGVKWRSGGAAGVWVVPVDAVVPDLESKDLLARVEACLRTRGSVPHPVAGS